MMSCLLLLSLLDGAGADTPTWEPEQSLSGRDGTFGYAMAIGDLNCDGRPDLVVGAPGAGGTSTYQGRIAVFYGTSAGLVDSFDWERMGGPGSQMGLALAIGDPSGDGCDDLAVSEPYRNEGDGGIGLYYGHPDGITVDPQVGAEGFGHDQLGVSLALADFDGDGAVDWAAGANGYDDEWATDGFGAVELRYGPEWGANPDAAPTATARQALGFSMALFETDGVVELLVGAPGFDSGRGAVWRLDPSPPAALDPDPLATGASYGEKFGGAVRNVGDVDGDGLDELGVCAPEAGLDDGEASVWKRTEAGWTKLWSFRGEPGSRLCVDIGGAGDLNGDGYADLLVSQAQDRVSWLFYGGEAGPRPSPAARLPGGSGVLALGDLVGDGYDDVAVGGFGEAVVRIFAGRPDADLDGVGAEEDCDDTDPSSGALRVVYSDEDGDGFGDPESERRACSADALGVEVAGDCDDTDANTNPAALDWPDDGRDQDCDGADARRALEDGTWSRSGCATGVGGAAAGVALAFLVVLGRRERER